MSRFLRGSEPCRLCPACAPRRGATLRRIQGPKRDQGRIDPEGGAEARRTRRASRLLVWVWGHGRPASRSKPIGRMPMPHPNDLGHGRPARMVFRKTGETPFPLGFAAPVTPQPHPPRVGSGTPQAKAKCLRQPPSAASCRDNLVR